MDETIGIEKSSVPEGDLHSIKQRLQDWRSQRKVGERIPELLWAEAVEAARRHGVNRVSIEMHLDYARLKRRVQGTEAPPPRSRNSQGAAKFVELLTSTATPPAAARQRHECVVELENARGAKMRVQLDGAGVAAALSGLCSAFWSA